MTIWVLPIEGHEQRYTAQWLHHLPAQLAQAAAARGVPASVVQIEGEIPPQVPLAGAFLDFAGTNIFKSTQIAEVARRFQRGDVMPGDTFLITDAWHPGVHQIRYMSALLQKPVQLLGLFHAGHYDPSDFLGRIAPRDLARPIRMETEQGRGATLFLPRRIFGDRADELAFRHGGVLAGSAYPLAQLLSGFLRHFNECAVSATPGLTHHLVPATVDLCRALAWEVSGSAMAAPPEETQLRFAVQQFIEQHLAQVDLPMLSARFGLSRTPLYQLFAPDGGVYAYIRDRRLTEAMRRLRHSEGRRPKIARLAHECGFRNDLVFSRAFRRKYGVNPSEVQPGPEMRVPLPTEAPLLGWLRGL